MYLDVTASTNASECFLEYYEHLLQHRYDPHLGCSDSSK